MEERKAVIQKIIQLIIDEMEIKDKGNLTSIYAIGILREAIADIEATALMRPLSHSLKVYHNDCHDQKRDGKTLSERIWEIPIENTNADINSLKINFCKSLIQEINASNAEELGESLFDVSIDKNEISFNISFKFKETKNAAPKLSDSYKDISDEGITHLRERAEEELLAAFNKI